jgi:hypothetical protein
MPIKSTTDEEALRSFKRKIYGPWWRRTIIKECLHVVGVVAIIGTIWWVGPVAVARLWYVWLVGGLLFALWRAWRGS